MDHLKHKPHCENNEKFQNNRSRYGYFEINRQEAAKIRESNRYLRSFPLYSVFSKSPRLSLRAGACTLIHPLLRPWPRFDLLDYFKLKRTKSKFHSNVPILSFSREPKDLQRFFTQIKIAFRQFGWPQGISHLRTTTWLSIRVNTTKVQAIPKAPVLLSGYSEDRK